ARLVVSVTGHYCDIEPEQWLIEAGIKAEVGEDLRRLKRPRFSNDPSFTLSIFGQRFDVLLAQSIFSHASQGQIRQCLAEASRVMWPFSLSVARSVPGRENYAGGEWAYGPHYPRGRLTDPAREPPLQCQPIEWPHPKGQQWLLLHPRGAVPPPLPALPRESSM